MTKAPPIRAVCFDLDGTLAHFTGDYAHLVTRACAALGVAPQMYGSFATRLAAEERLEGPGTLLRSVQTTLAALGVPPPKTLETLITEMIADYCNRLELLPGARETLALCRTAGLPLALITNAHADGQWAAVRALGLEDSFTHILISGDEAVAVRKPNPRIFALTLEALGTRPEETLMVGDNLEADIKGALACGLQAVYLGSETGPDFETLPDIAAFGRWLKERL